MLEQTATNLSVALLFRWLFQHCIFCNVEEVFADDDIEVD